MPGNVENCVAVFFRRTQAVGYVLLRLLLRLSFVAVQNELPFYPSGYKEVTLTNTSNFVNFSLRVSRVIDRSEVEICHLETKELGWKIPEVDPSLLILEYGSGALSVRAVLFALARSACCRC